MTAPHPPHLLDPEAAQFMLDSRNLQYLRPYVHEECSIQQAAQNLGISVGKMSYWTHKLLDRGLLVLIREVKRAGKPVRYYRATAEEFVAPISILPEFSDVELVKAHAVWWWTTFMEEVARAGRRAYPEWQLRVTGTDLLHRLEPALQEGLSVNEKEYPVNDWFHADLTPEQAEACQAELQALMKKYHAVKNEDVHTDKYMFHLGMVRRSP
ncbi:hypothetical protein [Deinococcus roseus]|uniref:ArsR family transcriptional regulator n=1 Tax=Deinococcus roseus TaxID=392414 RepID=A0ABQ2CY74_9DEIO|nr:hypothetical protein [Deinococcus roseus]GGJ32187.1 hypothetical protein GCM10008938_18000 [Deinococcus roseus]